MQSASTRRAFVGGTGIALAATALAGAECAWADKDEEVAWDEEYDVILIGSGSIMIGAARCAEAGDTVAVLEKEPFVGGNTVLSGGCFWLPLNGTSLNMDDTRSDAETYLNLVVGTEPVTDEVKAAFLDNTQAALQFTCACTGLTTIDTSQVFGFGDYHPHWKGARTAGRSVIFYNEEEGLPSHMAVPFVNAMQAYIESQGGVVMTETPAKHLIWRTDNNDVPEVLGVQAERDGKPLFIKACKGVILGAGGYGANQAWKDTFLPGPCPFTGGAAGQTGDGIAMGAELGAQLWSMHQVWGHFAFTEEARKANEAGIPAPLVFDMTNPGAIMVNRFGKRFVDESADYGTKWYACQRYLSWGDQNWENLPCWMVFDARFVDEVGFQNKGWLPGEENIPTGYLKADTLEELAQLTGIDPAGLVAEIERFNGFARAGVDEDFHRGENQIDNTMMVRDFLMNGHLVEGPTANLAPLETPPYYALEVGLSEIGTAGGLKINERSEVIHVSGKPVGRLYCAGNNAGLGFKNYGGSGGTLGQALTFGYIAGSNVTELQPWQ